MTVVLISSTSVLLLRHTGLLLHGFQKYFFKYLLKSLGDFAVVFLFSELLISIQ